MEKNTFVVDVREGKKTIGTRELSVLGTMSLIDYAEAFAALLPAKTWEGFYSLEEALKAAMASARGVPLADVLAKLETLGDSIKGFWREKNVGATPAKLAGSWKVRNEQIKSVWSRTPDEKSLEGAAIFVGVVAQFDQELADTILAKIEKAKEKATAIDLDEVF